MFIPDGCETLVARDTEQSFTSPNFRIIMTSMMDQSAAGDLNKMIDTSQTAYLLG